MIIILAILLVIGAVMLISAGFIKGEPIRKRKIFIIGCGLVAIPLLFMAFLFFVLIPAM
jgi:hypothetical protein